jgi:hypothetical protein
MLAAARRAGSTKSVVWDRARTKSVVWDRAC